MTTRIQVKVTPKAKRSEIIGWKDDTLAIRLAAIPDKGQANAELIRFLAKRLGVGRSGIQLIRGQTSRIKQLEINGLTLEEIHERTSS